MSFKLELETEEYELILKGLASRMSDHSATTSQAGDLMAAEADPEIVHRYQRAVEKYKEEADKIAELQVKLINNPEYMKYLRSKKTTR